MTSVESRLIVDIESPYAGPTADTIKRNILYARVACRWALEAGYIPYASHLFYTQPGILDDDIPTERELGILAGKTLIRSVAQKSIFFLDLGTSTGMKFGREDAIKQGREIEEILLFPNQDITHISFRGLLTICSEHSLLPRVYAQSGW